MLINHILFNANAQNSNPLISFLPIIIMFAALYFLFIMPQQKEAKKHKKMLENLKRGDNIITQAGILGTVTIVKDDVVHIEIAPKIEIKVLKSSITRVIEGNQDLKQ